MRIVRKGEVRVSGKRADISTRLATGERVRVPPLKIAPQEAPAVKRANPGDAEAIRAMILFEDRDVLVLNKPFGLAVQGGSGTKRHIDGMLQALADKEGNRPVLVHRLDRDTSGVLLIAKSRKMAAELGEIFRSRRAKKIYWALVEGVPKPGQGRISMFLAKGEGMGETRGQGRADLERMRVAKHGDPDAQHSLTLYAVVDKVAPRLAWLSMRPVTGRTHQLRAHCEEIGHPIVGDPKYNRRPPNDPARSDPLRAVPPGLEPKLHLLARRLVLPHPRKRSHRRDGAASGAHEKKLRHVRLRRDRTRSDRGRAGCVSPHPPDAARKDPMRAAQANMRPPPVGRFYKAVEVREADGRHALLLDGRGARTPGRNPLAAHEPGRSCSKLRRNGSGSATQSTRQTCR